jgi:hypothetical protein
MAVRLFNGTTDAIVCLPGAAASMAAAPFTYAALMKRNDTALQPIMAFANNATTTSSTFSNGLATTRVQAAATNNFYTACVADSIPTLAVVNADNWVLLVATKASGSVAVNHHRYVLGTATMTRAAGGAIADGAAPSGTFRFAFGKDEFTNFGAFYLATAAVWSVALSNAQVDEITSALSTASMFNNSAGVPKALWDFNQASTATPVPDLSGGGADQTAIAGTTVDTGNDPPGWTFGLTGPAAETLHVVQSGLRLA